MTNPELQLMVYGNNISKTSPVIDYDGVQINQIIKVESPNYLFLNITINTEAKSGSFDIVFKEGKKSQTQIQF